MKIALGIKIQKGPFGGGNQFGTALAEYLKKNNVEVVFDLKDNDIDLILLTDPRSYIISNAFGAVDVLNYIQNKNWATLLVQRINECDERKGTKTINKQLFLANSIMDYTIFIASWLISLFDEQGYDVKNYDVILNGADKKVFAFKEHHLPTEGKIRLVTHHWGASHFKGWDIYKKLDEMLGTEKYKNKLEFHYIGQKPDDIKTKNIIFHDPLSGVELANELNKNDIYVTGSINEPAGMHHVEGALCGLPLLYRESGALPEYCKGFGAYFLRVEDFERALDEMLQNYEQYSQNMKNYTNTSEKMCREYFEFFQTLIANKDEMLARRENRKFGFIGSSSFILKFYYYYFLNKVLKKY